MESPSFQSRLASAAARNKSWLMVGLDPAPDKLPRNVKQGPRGVLEFNRRIIEATRDLVIGYKPNFAFYEAMGPEGWDVLAKTRDAIPPDLIAFADAKRGDIGDTSEMYARAVFDILGFDAVTVSPYLGFEGIEPFLRRTDRGTFVLTRTSNRAESLQDAEIEGRPLYERVGETAAQWGVNVGLVVGATDLQALRRLRQLAPATPFLVPGVGAQGATAPDAVRTGGDEAGQNAIVSVSRTIIYASSGVDYAEAAREEARELLLSTRPYHKWRDA